MITLHTNIIEDEYTDYIKRVYDYDAKNANIVSIPTFNLPKDNWNIIAIIGASGSGKSTILNKLGGGGDTTFDERPIISNLGLPPKESAELLCAMGLSSIPTWCRPINNLSNGEKYRAKLAKIIAANDLSIIDEFTSVIDRNSAMAMSKALQKYIRRKNKKIILASCHYDILPFLKPDWIYDLNKGGVLGRGDYLQQPKIELRLYRTTPDTWRMFAKHHYMTTQHNDSAQCFVAQWNENPIAFISILPLFGKGIYNSMRVHRMVVLPEFQGLGIGKQLISAMGGIYLNNNLRLYIKTINPALGYALANDNRWIPTGHNLKYRYDIEKSDWQKTNTHKSRASYCYKYNGDNIIGFDNIIMPIDKLRRIKSLKGQLSLF